MRERAESERPGSSVRMPFFARAARNAHPGVARLAAVARRYAVLIETGVAPHVYRVEKNGAVHMYAFGRHVQTARNVGWTLSYAEPYYSPIYLGSVELTPGTREVRFDNGIVNGSCEGTEATRVRFVKPRFETY